MQQSTRRTIDNGRGGCDNSNDNDSEEVRDTTTTMMTMLSLLQTGRMMSTTACHQLQQQCSSHDDGLPQQYKNNADDNGRQ